MKKALGGDKLFDELMWAEEQLLYMRLHELVSEVDMIHQLMDAKQQASIKWGADEWKSGKTRKGLRADNLAIDALRIFAEVCPLQLSFVTAKQNKGGFRISNECVSFLQIVFGIAGRTLPEEEVRELARRAHSSAAPSRACGSQAKTDNKKPSLSDCSTHGVSQRE